MSRGEELGLSTLQLLSGDGMLTVLSELSQGPVRAGDIEIRAPGIARWTALRRLSSLAHAGFARPLDSSQPRRQRCRPGSPQTPHVLTRLGREYLLQVAAAAAHCEQAWCPSPLPAPGAKGVWALRLAADQPTRALARAVADAPLRTAELQVRLPQIRRSTLLRRLRTLPEHRVLIREEHGGEVRYGLSEGARHLVIVPLRAAQCEWRRASAADRARRADLPGLLHIVAPLGRTPHDTSGTCQWRIGADARASTDVYLAVAAGRVAALNAAPVSPPEAVSQASREAWCEAFLRADPSAIGTVGDQVLFNSVFAALSSALLA